MKIIFRPIFTLNNFRYIFILLILFFSFSIINIKKTEAVVSVGDSFEGGIVAYIFTPDDIGYIEGQVRGILAAPTDLSPTGLLYGCPYDFSGGSGSLIGTGSQNTLNLITNCPTAGTPARLASDLVIEGNGDWFLPSKDELRKIYLSRALIGNFKVNLYWSSTESGAYSAYMHSFANNVNGPMAFSKVDNMLYARAIRYFEDIPEPVVISNQNITGIEVPVNGSTPTLTISDTIEYTATISWSENPTTFEGDKVYTATINIIPKTNYKLEGIPENFFQVAGATGVTNSINSGVVTAVFPKTSPNIITAATVSTTTATVINSNSATLNGDITNTGGENVSSRGFEYGFNTTYGANTISTGSFSAGSYSDNISGLTCNTTYHYRSFANNSAGLSYGNDQTFTTNNCSTVVTGHVSNAISKSVTLNGSITDVSGGNFTTRGFNYGLTTDYGLSISENGSFGLGEFSSNIDLLLDNTTYHYRVYGINAQGISYGDDNIFEISPLIEQITSTKKNWYDIASSADGSKLAAVNFGPDYGYTGSIYTSIDSGANWIERISSNVFKWKSIASSSDGTKLAAATYPGYIYTSEDSGITWIERTNSVSRNWTSIVSSADGTKLAASGGGYISTSIDSGATWVRRDNAGYRNWTSLSSSADGEKLVAIVNAGYVYTSSDGGESWIERKSLGSRLWLGVDSSSDGLKIVVIDGEDGGYIYTSTDGGESWIIRNNYIKDENSELNMWRDVSSSADGTILAVIGIRPTGISGEYVTYVYISNDSGATWTRQVSSESFKPVYTVSLSDDGSKIAMSGQDMNIYTHTLPSIPLLNTEEASAVTESTAILNATIINLNGEYPISKGFEYGLTTDYGQVVEINSPSSERSYALDVTALEEDTTYHFISYATNSIGTGYGTDETFTTSSLLGQEIISFSPLSDIDGGSTAEAIYPDGASVIAVLPTSVRALTQNGEIDIPVSSWVDTDNFDPQIAGSYTFSAVLGEIPPGYSNINNLSITVDVTIMLSSTEPHPISLSKIIGLTPPVTGAAPTITISDTDEYTTSISWLPNDLIFKDNTIYTAILTLTPKTGYTLSGISSNFFTISGGSATNNENSGIITVVFPKTTKVTEPQEDVNNPDQSNNIGQKTGTAIVPRYHYLVKENKLKEAEDLRKMYPEKFADILTPLMINKSTAETLQNDNKKPLEIYRNLRIKMTGEDVRQLQVYLNNHGFTVAQFGPGSINNETTYFGPATNRAVIAFQKINKLTADGIVGPKTKSLIKY